MTCTQTVEVGIDETKRDTKFLGNAALRLTAVIDRIEQIEDDPLVLSTMIYRALHDAS
jgi:hypothetical protein